MKVETMPFFPMRPISSHELTIACDRIYRPKVDGDRVLIDIYSKQAWNRHGDVYSKAHRLPWDELDYIRNHVPKTIFKRYIDCEFLCKHMIHKGKIAIIDFPERELTFEESLRKINEAVPIRLGGLQIISTNILMLPYFDPLHTHTCVETQYENLRRTARAWMEEFNETTPFYEGLVSVHKDSMYKKTYKPNQPSHLWIKHRFSTK